MTLNLLNLRDPKRALQQSARSLTRIAERMLSAVPRAEIMGGFNNPFATSWDLICSVVSAGYAKYLKHPDWEQRIDPALIATRFVELAAKEVEEEKVYVPAGPVMLAGVFLIGTDDQGRKSFVETVFELVADRREYYLPVAIFKHLALNCRLQYTPAQQRLIREWAAIEDNHSAKLAEQLESSAKVERKPYSNLGAVDAVLKKTQEQSWR